MVTVAVNSAVTLPPAILAPALFALTELVTVTLTWHPASLQLIWPSPCRLKLRSVSMALASSLVADLIWS